MNCEICREPLELLKKAKDNRICKYCEDQLNELIYHYNKSAFNYFKGMDFDSISNSYKMVLHVYFDYFRVNLISESQRLFEYQQLKESILRSKRNEDCFESKVEYCKNVGFNFSYETVCKYTSENIIKWNCSLLDCYNKEFFQLVYYSNLLPVLVIRGKKRKVISCYLYLNKQKKVNLSGKECIALLKIISINNSDVTPSVILKKVEGRETEKFHVDYEKLQKRNCSDVELYKKRIQDYWYIEPFADGYDIRRRLEAEKDRQYWADYYSTQRQINYLAKTQKYDLRPSKCSGGLCTPK